MYMSIVTTLIAIAAGYGIATAIEKGKVKELEALISQKTEKEKTKELPIPNTGKPESEKDVLDIMGDIAHRDELDKFTLVERKNEKAKYQYLKNDVLFTIIVDDEYVECQVKRKGTTVVEYVFDLGWDEYDKKTISRSIMESRTREEAMEIIEDFMYEVNTYYWDDLEANIEIVDDVKEIKPVAVDTNVSHGFTITSGDGFAEMEKMEKIIAEENMNDEVGEAMLDIISKIKKATEEIKILDKELDIEAKHVYDELIKKDLSKLFNAYLKLEEESRQNYKEKILDGLNRIESKTSEILKQIENKNLHEVDAILHVIKQRYEE